MSNIRLPVAVCSAVADVVSGGSHKSLEELFLTAGAPGPPPDLSHATKWKTWLQKAGNDPEVDSLAVLGNLIEEFMDLPPLPSTEKSDIIPGFLTLPDPLVEYKKRKVRLIAVLEEHGFRYFRGGRVIPSGDPEPVPGPGRSAIPEEGAKPSSIEDLLTVIIRGLPRAIQPLVHRRKDSPVLSFSTEYDIQDLLHSQLRPWVADIRPEEFTPSYAGSNTRMDFLLPTHQLVIETKRVRDKYHAKKIGDELIIDIAHYQRHPAAAHLWCVIYDPELYISNPSGVISDLEGVKEDINVKVFIVGTSA